MYRHHRDHQASSYRPEPMSTETAPVKHNVSQKQLNNVNLEERLVRWGQGGLAGGESGWNGLYSETVEEDI